MINKLLFQTIIDTIPTPVIITDGHNIIKCNQDFLHFFNHDDLDTFKKYNNCVCHLFIKHKDYFSLASIDENTIWTDYLFHDKREHKVSLLNSDGEATAFRLTINPLKDDDGRAYYIIVFSDITAILTRKKLLERMAYHDPLTKIYNRQMFKELYEKERENKKRHGDTLTLIMFDIDHFKQVNDTYGHHIGDEVLVTLTKLITKNLRTNDVFARWGGEEFMILLLRTTLDIAYDKAQELRQVIESYNDDAIPNITVSFGVTEIVDTDEEQTCFKRVDEALYGAKINRNDVVKI